MFDRGDKILNWSARSNAAVMHNFAYPRVHMARHHEDLEKSFSDEQKEVFEKFHDCWSEYMSLAEASIFEYAFKLGMQIAIETLTDK